MKKITLTVINDLTYDQRMHRICTSLATTGYDITLIGRRLTNSLPLTKQPYKQKRIDCFFSNGKLMYIEFNLRLLLTLFLISTDCFVSIDLDTIMPNYFSSKVRRKRRVYDAHELFTEQKEIVSRSAIRKLWLSVERFAVPRFKHGYSVNQFIIDEFKKRYNVNYWVIRNLPVYADLPAIKQERFIIYQGAVNEGRSFETLIPAMRKVDAKLVICGQGNFSNQVKLLIDNHEVKEKIELRGMVVPEELKLLTPTAYIAVMLFEKTGLNQYQSLANRFFDYIMAGVPQVCVNYPQYAAINSKYQVAHLISDTKPETIADALNHLLNNNDYYCFLRNNCLKARKELNWQIEEKVLLKFYEQLFEE